MAALAREPKPHRTFGKPPGARLAKPPKPKAMKVKRPPIMQRRVPSLPTMPWHDTDSKPLAR